MRFYFWAVLSAVLFGASIPVTKVLVSNMGPVLLAGICYAGAALTLIPLSLKELRTDIPRIASNRKDALKLGGAALFGGILGPSLLFFGLNSCKAQDASLLLNLETAATAVVGTLFFREYLGRRTIAAVLITIGAGMLLAFDRSFRLNSGSIFIALACISWGIDNNLTATIESVSPKTNTIIKGCAAGICNIAAGIIVFKNTAAIPQITYALIVGGLSYGVSIVLYISSARAIGAVRSQIIFALNPFFGALAALVVFRDIPNVQFIAAAACMGIAVFLLSRERHEHEHTHKTIEHTHEHRHDDGHHLHAHDATVPLKHTHEHSHALLVHSHGHMPDVHHRHVHE